MNYCKDNRDKMLVYSFCMTILIVIYHLVPHLIDLIDFRGGYKYYRNFFELFGSIALNYFFAASAYKYFVSCKTMKEKICNRLRTLLIPYFTWNTIYIFLYVLQNGIPSVKTLILGYTINPFDGPLWYIFVLFIFFILFGKKINYKNVRVFKGFIIMISVIFALFHFCVVKELFNFPYAYWLERTCRMIPPFLVGGYLAREPKYNQYTYHGNKLLLISALVISILLATYIGDGAIAILLMYLCTFGIWIACPNFELRKSSLMRQDTFSIYAIHEGIIVVILALIYKLKILVSSMVGIMCIMVIELILIISFGLIINLLLKKLPPFFDTMLTGGRNSKKSKVY